MSKLIKTDLVYKEWIQDVSRRFRRSQLNAAVKVNNEMLRFYWSLGQDISRMSKDARYQGGKLKIFGTNTIHFAQNKSSYVLIDIQLTKCGASC